MRKRASKKVLNFCQRHRESVRCAVSHYFSYAASSTAKRNSKSRDTVIKMCTHTRRDSSCRQATPTRSHSHTDALPYQLPKGKTAKCRHFQLRHCRQQASSLSGSKTHQLTQNGCRLSPPHPPHTTIHTQRDSNFIDGSSGRLKACYTFVTAACCQQNALIVVVAALVLLLLLASSCHMLHDSGSRGSGSGSALGSL